MPLNGSDVASKPTGTTAVPDSTIESAKYNSVVDDVYSILNTVRTVAKGYTGATNAADARTNLGIAVDVATRTLLKALDTTKDTTAIFDGSLWVWTAGDFADEITADPTEGVYAKADAIAATAGAWVRSYSGAVVPEWFGGVTDVAIQAMMDWAASFSQPVMVGFRKGVTYTVGATVDCDLPEGSVIDARGAQFTCTHNGVAFDLNAPATATIPRTDTLDTVTKRRIYWRGGEFTNTNATKTASVAIQAYFMRGCYFDGMYVTGFYAGWKFGAKDTYHWNQCYTYDCTRHYWVPAAGVLFTGSLTGNDLIHTVWTGCHISCPANEAGIYFENRVIGFSATDTSFNGAATVAHVRLSDNATLYSRGIKFDGVHFEQADAGVPSVLFVAAGGWGFFGVDFDGGTEFTSATVGWHGVTMAECGGVNFGTVTFTDGSGGATEQCIYVDDDSRDILISEQCQFLSVASGQAVVLESAAARANITVEPAFVPNTGVLTGYNLTTQSTGTATLDMSSIYPSYSTKHPILPPKAYALQIRASDSGSAASAFNTCFARIKKNVGSSDISGIEAQCGALANSVRVSNSGAVEADENGDVYLAINASGAGTLTLGIGVNGAWQ